MKLLQVSNIKVDITEDEKTAFKKALKKAGLSKDKVSSWKIIKLSHFKALMQEKKWKCIRYMLLVCM